MAETLISRALSAHEAAGPGPRSFADSAEWGQRLGMSPEEHLVHCVYLAEKDKHLPDGEAFLQRVLRDARGAGIPEAEIKAALEAARGASQ
ncbi:MAG TPA: hypothetical protein VMT37_09545 [Solirubrobacterales bacterium]|nr:hypothetical protein [Solirubrobacterales bacterium]